MIATILSIAGAALAFFGAFVVLDLVLPSRVGERGRRRFRLLAAALLVLTSLGYHLEIEPGVIVDARGAAVACVTLFAGPLGGLAATLLAIAYRLLLGGAGAIAGVLGLALDYGLVLAVVVGARRLGFTWRDSILPSLAAGLAAGTGEALSLLLVPPASLGRELFDDLGPTLLLVQVACTVVVAALNRVHDGRRREGQALAALAQRYQLISRHANDGILLFDEELRVVEANERAAALYGYSPEEMLALAIEDLRPPQSAPDPGSELLAARRPQGTVFESVHLRQDGGMLPVEVSSREVLLAGKSHLLSVIRDIRERKAHERQVERLSKINHALRLINEAIVHASDSAGLEAEVCRILVEAGGLKLAWIGRPDRQAWIRPAARSGDDQRYLDSVRISVDGSLAEGNGATGAAIREQTPQVIDDFLGESASRPELADAVRRGLRSALAIPFREAGVTSGALTVYSGEAGFFGEREIALAEEAAKALSFGLDVLSQERERRAASAALAASELRFRSLVSDSPAVIYTCNAETWRTTFVSDNVLRVIGYLPRDFVTEPNFWHDRIHPDDRTETLAAGDRITGFGTQLREYRFRHADGSWRWMQDEARLVAGAGRPVEIVGCWIDVTERRQAEEALRAREEIFAGIAGRSLDGMLLIDAETLRFVEFNDAACAMLGYSREEFSRLGLGDVERRMTWKELRTGIDALGEGGTTSIQTRLGVRDGSTRDVHVRATRIRLRGHWFLTAVWTDVTERLAAEAEIGKLTRAIEQSPVSIVITDLSGSIEYVNPHFTRVTGYSLEEARGQNPRILKSGLTPPETYREMWQTLLRGAIWRGELTNRKRSGETYIELAVIAPVLGADGKATHFVAIKEDITERKRAEIALVESEERYRLIADNTADVIWLYDFAADAFSYVSPSVRSLCGRTPEELTGHPMRDFLTTESAAEMERGAGPRFAALRAGDESARTRVHEVDVRHRDGHVVPTEEVSTLLVDAAGKVTGLLGVSRDISERRQAEAALRAERASLARRVEERTADLSRVNAQLAQAVRAKDEFLANMSHELRTPLNAILALSESLLEQLRGPLNERQQASLRTIEASGRHLLALINDILDLSKVEAGRLELQLAEVSLADAFESALAFVRELAGKRQLTISVRLEDQLARVHADPKRLKQMLVNLLSNAVKFTAPGGRVSLEAEVLEAESTVRIAVTDTGVGIAPEALPKLFQPFTQLDSSLSRQHEGSGLGLALVRRLAELHGGSISVESAPGKGSRFTLALPQAARRSEATPRGDRGIEERSPREPRSALVVEDSESAAEQLGRYLGELHVHATVHATVAGACDTARRLHPDLLFLDLLLPDGSGWEVLQALRSDPATSAIPVIVASVVDERSRGLAAGAAEYLLKPVTRESLRQALDRVLHGKAPGHEAMIVAPLPASAADGRSGRRILLAEDNEVNIQAIGDYLQDKGFQVLVARNGREAVELAESELPDLVIMDIQMPEMDGLEATRRLRERPRLAHVPVLALTALAMPGDRDLCLAAGADEYLTKPVSLKGLLATIEQRLARATTGPAA